MELDLQKHIQKIKKLSTLNKNFHNTGRRVGRRRRRRRIISNKDLPFHGKSSCYEHLDALTLFQLAGNVNNLDLVRKNREPPIEGPRRGLLNHALGGGLSIWREVFPWLYYEINELMGFA